MQPHRLEPAKLLAGAVLLLAAALAALDAVGGWRLPDWLPLAVVPPGLAVAAVIVAGGYASRRAERRAAEARSVPQPQLGAMPMDELRRHYDTRLGSLGEPGDGGAGDGEGRDGGRDSGTDGPPG